MAAATPILIFHKTEPSSWSLTPGPWFLHRRRLRIPSPERRVRAGSADRAWPRVGFPGPGRWLAGFCRGKL